MAGRPLIVVLAAVVLAASCTGGNRDVVTQQVDDSVGVDPPIGTADPPTTDVPVDSGTPPATTVDGQPIPPPLSDPTTTLAPRADPGMLDWTSCEPSAASLLPFECATLRVPLDHAEPGGPTIDIAVSRTRATGPESERIGSLVTNPGGPGGSGIETLAGISFLMSAQVTSKFDLVGFDPRGVGASSALECNADRDDDIPFVADGDVDAWDAAVAENEARLETCTADTLALAPYVGTNNAARDMDLLRAALGDDKLTYLGYSYGTRLGAAYAELFPGNVRALVLDGGVKPDPSNADLNREQGAGFDQALENFAAACDVDTDCALQGAGPTLAVIDALTAEITDLGQFPTDDDGRVLTPGELNLGIAGALYSKESWPYLASALSSAEREQDGTLLQVLGDQLVGRRADGTYNNSTIASTFINCADDPARVSLEDQQRLADEAADLSEHFGEFLRGSTGCLGIAPALDPLAVGTATGAPPILVIGTSGDPATPYEWSVELADLLDSGVLFTVEAEGHTAYGSIACVQPPVDAYLVDLVVAADLSCSDDVGSDFFLPPGESDLDQVLAFFACLRDSGADFPEITAADVIADPTLETVIELFDFGDPAFTTAFAACSDLIADL